MLLGVDCCCVGLLFGVFVCVVRRAFVVCCMLRVGVRWLLLVACWLLVVCWELLFGVCCCLFGVV